MQAAQVSQDKLMFEILGTVCVNSNLPMQIDRDGIHSNICGWTAIYTALCMLYTHGMLSKATSDLLRDGAFHPLALKQTQGGIAPDAMIAEENLRWISNNYGICIRVHHSDWNPESVIIDQYGAATLPVVIDLMDACKHYTVFVSDVRSESFQRDVENAEQAINMLNFDPSKANLKAGAEFEILTMRDRFPIVAEPVSSPAKETAQPVSKSVATEPTAEDLEIIRLLEIEDAEQDASIEADRLFALSLQE